VPVLADDLMLRAPLAGSLCCLLSARLLLVEQPIF